MKVEFDSEEIRSRMKEKKSDYIRGFSMVLSFRQPQLKDVQDAYSSAVEEVLALIEGRSL